MELVYLSNRRSIDPRLLRFKRSDIRVILRRIACLALLFNAFDEVRNSKFLVHSQHIIHLRQIGYLAGLELCVAARHDQHRIGVLAANTMDGLAVFVVGSVGHRAGIDDTHIGLFALFGTDMPTLH